MCIWTLTMLFYHIKICFKHLSCHPGFILPDNLWHACCVFPDCPIWAFESLLLLGLSLSPACFGDVNAYAGHCIAIFLNINYQVNSCAIRTHPSLHRMRGIAAAYSVVKLFADNFIWTISLLHLRLYSSLWRKITQQIDVLSFG